MNILVLAAALLTTAPWQTFEFRNGGKPWIFNANDADVTGSFARRRGPFGLFSAGLPSPQVFRAHNRPNTAGRGQTYWIAPEVLVPFAASSSETAKRIAAEFGKIKSEISAVVPYRLDADTVLDPEKAMKRRFTNDDAIDARRKVARWICELE